MTRLWPLAPLVVLILAGLVGPLVVPAEPWRTDLRHVLARPDMQHLFGTDHLGRDVLARLVAALRVSLALALVSTACAAVVGTGLGLLAAHAAGTVERVLSAVADGIVALPALLLLLLVSALAPGQLWPLYIGLAATLWVEYFRVSLTLARAQLVGLPVQASRLLGFGEWYVLRRHVWPAVAPALATLAVFGIGSAVLAVATVSFLGVGLRPPRAELGLMMSEYFPYVFEAPWLIAIPTAALGVAVTSLAWASHHRE